MTDGAPREDWGMRDIESRIARIEKRAQQLHDKTSLPPQERDRIMWHRITRALLAVVKAIEERHGT